jgi:hypothetical protein
MLQAGFEPTIPESEQAQALDLAATIFNNIFNHHYSVPFVTFALRLVSHVAARSALHRVRVSAI